MPDPILQEASDERRLTEEGLVRLPLLGEDALDELRELHERTHPHGGSGFDTDFAYAAPDHKRIVDEGIRAVVGPALESVLQPFRLYNATFVVKWPGAAGQLPVHQDWANVEEPEGRSCTVWIPLDATSPDLDNGPLGFVPRSHLVPAYRRGANSRPWYWHYRDSLMAELEYPEVELGDALLFDARMLHGSDTNRTDVPRRSVTVMVTSERTPLRYHRVVGRQWFVYDVDDDFFVRNDPIRLRADAPEGARLVEVSEASTPVAPLAELESICGVRLEPVAAPVDPGMPELAGTPLGGPAAGPSDADLPRRRRLRGAAERRVRRPSPTPVVDDAPGLADLSAHAPAIVAAWSASAVEHGAWPRWTLPGGDGHDWPVRAVPGSGDGEFVRAVRRVVGDAACWLVSAPPHAVTVPRRGASTRSLAVLPLRIDQASGSLLLHVGGTVVPLDVGEVVAFDEAWEHAAYNFGASRPDALVVALPRTRFGRAIRQMARRSKSRSNASIAGSS